MGIVFECLDKLHLMSDHCGIKQCFKNSMSTWLLLLNWKNSFMPTMLVGMRVSRVLRALASSSDVPFQGRCTQRSHGAQSLV